ncbi:hypothetical protein Efla_006296 [Eimeria flavescens]
MEECGPFAAKSQMHQGSAARGEEDEVQSTWTSTSSASLTSQVSGIAGGLGKWLLNSASTLVTEIAAETVDAKNDLKEFCNVIASDSASWLRRQWRTDPACKDEAADSGDCSQSSNSAKQDTDCMQRTVRMKEEERSDNSDHVAQPAAPQPGRETETASASSREDLKNEEEEQKTLPPWRTNSNLHGRLLCILMSDASFLTDPSPDGRASPMEGSEKRLADSGEGHSSNLKDGAARNNWLEGGTLAAPSEEEKRAYLQDPDVNATFKRFVPEKVGEELFWKRLHARVCEMMAKEEQVSVHLKKLCKNAAAEESSESEADISWEDLGS